MEAVTLNDTNTKPAVSATETRPKAAASAWWLVLCLIGLDYFSALAYVPSLAIQAVGPLAPLAAAVVVLATLFAALPVYLYVVGRSPHGRGATGLIERLVPGWRGKLLVLLLLSFVATDYVVTQNLSVADAAEHVRANPVFQNQVNPWLDLHWHPETWFNHPWWLRVMQLCDRQLAVALALSLITFALWTYWQRGSTERFLRVAAVVVAAYLLINAVLLASGAVYLAGDGRVLFDQWYAQARAQLGGTDGLSAGEIGRSLFWLALASFPYVALGLSGFELSMTAAPLVRGAPDDDPAAPRGRIRNMRLMLTVAAVVMSVGLLTAVSTATMLIPQSAFDSGGPAVHRALAYLAHGGTLADGRAGAEASAFLGPTFGMAYDAITVVMLCLAGACVAIVLRDYVPEYLQRLGMELTWAHRLGVKLQLFNVVVLVVVVLFRARIESLQWVYVTSVLVLLSGAALAAMLDIRRMMEAGWRRRLAAIPPTLVLAFFAAMTLLALWISRAGLEIAVAFGVGIFATSLLSRWIRSTELRFDGFEFVDAESRRRWEECCAHEFQVLVPHRPGLHSRVEKAQMIRRRHRIAPMVPLIIIEATLEDPSEFLHKPLMRVCQIDGFDLIQVSQCASIAHVLAAIALEMSQVGRPAELHFGWSDESPIAANLNFLLFGEGNVPWMVRDLLRRAQADVERRPAVVIG